MLVSMMFQLLFHNLVYETEIDFGNINENQIYVVILFMYNVSASIRQSCLFN